MKQDKKILDRVRKLLALANDSSASEGEIENALKAAELLIAKHNLERNELEFSKQDIDRDYLEEKVSGQEPNDWIWDLTAVISKGYNCRAIGYKFYDYSRNGLPFERRGIQIIGFEEDREVVKELVMMTVPLVRNLHKQRYRQARESGTLSSSEFIFINSYIKGFLSGLNTKLQSQRKDKHLLTEGERAKYELMVVKKDELVSDFIKDTMELGQQRNTKSTLDHGAYFSGVEDSKNSSLSRQLQA